MKLQAQGNRQESMKEKELGNKQMCTEKMQEGTR